MRFAAIGLAIAVAVAVGAPVFAQESDEAALALADRTSTAATVTRTCIEYAEAAAIETGDGVARKGGRASFNVRCEGALASRWRVVLSDRFDELWGRGMSSQGVNTLKEAYVSFRPDGAILADLGRINVREGVALAYNPTDYFKANSVRTLISIDPETLRVEARRERESLCLRVTDTGVGLNAGSPEGVGLANVRARLSSLYGEGGRLALYNHEPHGVVAEITMPLQGA